jgi:chromosome segregation ATPase
MFTDEKLETLEQTGAILAAVILLICTVGSPLASSSLTREQLVTACVQSNRRAAQLQASLRTTEDRVKAVQVQVADRDSAVAKLQRERDAFKIKADDAATQATNAAAGAAAQATNAADQAATAAAKVQELESQLQAARAEIAKLNNKPAQDDLAKRYAEAVARANKDEDRIRELTLQLHKAGLWP